MMSSDVNSVVPEHLALGRMSAWCWVNAVHRRICKGGLSASLQSVGIRKTIGNYHFRISPHHRCRQVAAVKYIELAAALPCRKVAPASDDICVYQHKRVA